MAAIVNAGGTPTAALFFSTIAATLFIVFGGTFEKVITVLAFFWSPDGRYIAYITVAGQDDGEQAAGGLTTVSLTESEPAAQQGNLRLALWVVDVESGLGQQRLVFRPTAMYLTQFLPFFDQYALSHRIWSPDSAALVLPIAGDTPQEDTIYVVPIKSDSEHFPHEGK